jgi:hypothetical protein
MVLASTLGAVNGWWMALKEPSSLASNIGKSITQIGAHWQVYRSKSSVQPSHANKLIITPNLSVFMVPKVWRTSRWTKMAPPRQF